MKLEDLLELQNQIEEMAEGATSYWRGRFCKVERPEAFGVRAPMSGDPSIKGRAGVADDFMKSYRNAKADYANHTKRLKAWKDKQGMKYAEQQFAETQNAHGHSYGQTQRRIKP